MQENKRIDPDPIVLDLTVSLASMAVGGALKKLAEKLFSQRNRDKLDRNEVSDKEIAFLRESIEELEGQVEEALSLVSPGCKRELGGTLMLDRQSLQRYHALRESLFTHVREADEFVEQLLPESEIISGRNPRKRRLPQKISDQLKYVETKLKQARTAGLADEALLEVRSAITTMKRTIRMLENELGL